MLGHLKIIKYLKDIHDYLNKTHGELLKMHQCSDHRLECVEEQLECLNERLNKMANQLEVLEEAVTRLLKEQLEAIALIKKLLEPKSDDPVIANAIVKINAVSDALNEFTPDDPPPPA